MLHGGNATQNSNQFNVTMNFRPCCRCLLTALEPSSCVALGYLLRCYIPNAIAKRARFQELLVFRVTHCWKVRTTSREEIDRRGGVGPPQSMSLLLGSPRLFPGLGIAPPDRYRDFLSVDLGSLFQVQETKSVTRIRRLKPSISVCSNPRSRRTRT
jgi:hypothetical protein